MKLSSRALLLPLLLGGCAGPHPFGGPSPATNARARLTHDIDSMVNAPAFRTANWGILIVDPLASDTLYAHNAAKLFIPASNQKLVSTSVLLESVGPEFRYRTVIGARGSVAEETLNGDLTVAGRGDPTASDHMKGDAMLPLRDIADSVWQRGIRHISGKVMAVGNAFPGPVAGYDWPWASLDGTSFAGVDELLFNEGLSTVRVWSGANVGDTARIETKPARTYPVIRNRVVTVARDTAVALAGRGRGAAGARTGGAGRGFGRGGAGSRITAHHDTATMDVVVSGQITLGDSAQLTIAQHDPDAAYVAALTEALRERGVTVDGQSPQVESEHVDSLFAVSSVPLREILPFILKPSQNQIAEIFLRTIGLERTGVGTADSGRAVVGRQFTEWKIPSDGYVVRDGSGLSRSDLISPEAIVDILDVMRRSPNFDVFYPALPIAGVDGTIGTRMKGTPAEGNVHAKTGTLGMVRSLSGYVHTADGRLLEFSILCNNWMTPQAEVDRVADTIAVALASLRRN